MGKKLICWLLEGHRRKEQDPEPDSLVRCTDPRIRIRTDPEHCTEQKIMIEARTKKRTLILD